MLFESRDTQRKEDLRQKAAEFSRLRNELLRSRRAVSVMTGEDAVNLEKEAAFKAMISPLEQRRIKYLKRKQAHGDRDNEVLLLPIKILNFALNNCNSKRLWKSS